MDTLRAILRSGSAYVLLGCLATLLSSPALSVAGARPVPNLPADARAQLAAAAADPAVTPWQRDFMLRSVQGSPPTDARQAAMSIPAARAAYASDATDGAWSELVIGGRANHSAIYDPPRDRMIVFGGSGIALGLRSDVWALSLSGTPTWTVLAPAGTPPSAREDHSAIYDAVRDRMLVFGGFDGLNYSNEVWALTLSGTPTWTRLTPTGTPPSGRYAHSAIYDPVRDRMVVFGGVDTSSTVPDDVWALTLSGTPAWVELTPTDTRLAGRAGHSAIYDSVRDRMLVFGGNEGAPSYAYLSEVWAFSLAGTSAWTALSPTGTPPAARSGHSAIYDPGRDCMVAFGGVGWAGGVWSDFNDCCVLALAGTPTWMDQGPPSGRGTPSARDGHSAIYDPVRDRMVVFGGYSDSGLTDVWALPLAGGSWLSLEPIGTPPGERQGHSAIYDPVRDRMLVFGGFDFASGLRFDVWALSQGGGGRWTELTPDGTPPPARQGQSAMYDPVRDRMLIFGGTTGADPLGGTVLDDAWALSLAGAPTWTEFTPAGPRPSGGVAMYDPVRDRIVVLGGDLGVWALPLATPEAWTALNATGTPPSLGSPIYDPVRDRMVVIGRRDGTAAIAWSLPLEGPPEWTELSPTGTPPSGRYAHSVIYDPLRDRIVMFGGYDEGITGPNDVWALTLSGTPAWVELTPTGTPPGRYAHSVIYDPTRDRMAVFGGVTMVGCEYCDVVRNDVWALTWGTPALASVTCPGDIVWTPDASIAASYEVTNPYSFAQAADYTLRSGRDWPGFPISGSAAIDAGSTVPIPISVPVPDSAAVGLNPMTLQVTLRSLPQFAMCSHNLHDTTTPTLLSPVSADAEPDRVRLTWYAAGETDLLAKVYRRTAEEAWRVAGDVSPDGTGLIVFEDREVSPGVRYGYRLGFLEQGREVFAGEIWVEVPLTPQFALAGVRPNPVAADLAVAFSLPDASPARLEVFDLGGRRLVTREVGSLGAGSHMVRLAEGRTLASGVYMLRLTRGGCSVTTRAVIVH